MTWMRCGRRLRRKCKGRQSLKSFKTDEIRQLDDEDEESAKER